MACTEGGECAVCWERNPCQLRGHHSQAEPRGAQTQSREEKSSSFISPACQPGFFFGFLRFFCGGISQLLILLMKCVLSFSWRERHRSCGNNLGREKSNCEVKFQVKCFSFNNIIKYIHYYNYRWVIHSRKINDWNLLKQKEAWGWWCLEKMQTRTFPETYILCPPKFPFYQILNNIILLWLVPCFHCLHCK